MLYLYCTQRLIRANQSGLIGTKPRVNPIGANEPDLTGANQSGLIGANEPGLIRAKLMVS